MNAMTVVMNNTDLLKKVFEFAFEPIPDKCFDCDVRTKELHLWKTFLAKQKITFPNVNKVFFNKNDIPRKICDNKDLVESMKVETIISNKTVYRCSTCWCMNLRNTVNLGLYTAIIAEVQLHNPSLDEKKARVKAKKELRLIYEDEILFKNHRIEKTKQKEERYRNIVYKALCEQFHSLREEQRDFGIQIKDDMLSSVNKNKIYFCRIMSTRWTNEIKIRKIAKLFSDKKISYECFFYISTRFFNTTEIPSLEYMFTESEDYFNRHRSCVYPYL